MKIAIIGSGYVGLVTAACLAERGNTVFGIDIDPKKIRDLQRGAIPIYEPGLGEMVVRNSKAKRLFFSTRMKDIADAEIVFIAVGTPSDEHGNADLRAVYAVASSIGDAMQQRMVVVNKSTVPVGTAKAVEKIIANRLRRRRKKIDFAVVSNPEFLKEGAAIDDFMKPDRIVLGVDKKWAGLKMQELYAPFMKNGHPILTVSRESSEMSKYGSNAMLACKISFMNQLANMCELMGANVDEVREAMSLDTRIGAKFLYAGIGYGGSCFPKDVQALIVMAKQSLYSAPLLEAIESVNQQQKKVLPRKILKTIKHIEGKRFALWGLAFKPHTDDVREAPAITIIEDILAKGGTVVAYDPKATQEMRKHFGDRITYAKDMYAACKGADALVIATEWPEFHEPDFQRIKKSLRAPYIFDGRNMYDPRAMHRKGFHYVSIGR